MGDKAFSLAGPRAWNQLPHELRTEDDLDSFKKKLKTCYFRMTYA